MFLCVRVWGEGAHPNPRVFSFRINSCKYSDPPLPPPSSSPFFSTAPPRPRLRRVGLRLFHIRMYAQFFMHTYTYTHTLEPTYTHAWLCVCGSVNMRVHLRMCKLFITYHHLYPLLGVPRSVEAPDPVVAMDMQAAECRGVWGATSQHSYWRMEKGAERDS